MPAVEVVGGLEEELTVVGTSEVVDVRGKSDSLLRALNS